MSNVKTSVQPSLAVDAAGAAIEPPAAVAVGVSKPLDVGTPATSDVSIAAGVTFLLDFLTVHCAGLTAGAAITVTVSYKYPALGAAFTTVIAMTTGAVVSSGGTFDFYLDLDDYRIGEGIGVAFSLLNVTVTTASVATGTANFATGAFGPITEN